MLETSFGDFEKPEGNGKTVNDVGKLYICWAVRYMKNLMKVGHPRENVDLSSRWQE